MRVLLSAYACEPGKGSEPGVGWRWAIEIARRGHQVTVLTRANNRPAIESGIKSDSTFPFNIDFAYYDPPAWSLAFKRTFKAVLPFYFFWQWGAYRWLAKQLHKEKRFDLVHHLTFVSIRHFSFMWRLGIPFVIGPVGGGETSPFWLRWHTGWRGGLRDTWRDAANLLSRFDPVANAAWKRAIIIAVTTSETLRLIPHRYRSKTRCVLQIGIDQLAGKKASSSSSQMRCKRVVFIGRFLYWKGMALGIRAFAIAAEADPSLTLTMVGKGPEQKRWQNLAKRLGIAERLQWEGWVCQDRLKEILSEHGVLLFPTLHDSGGQVVLEAASNGLPIVCLRLGGPGTMVDDKLGAALETGHGKVERLFADLANQILRLTSSPAVWETASMKARESAERWNWVSRVAELGVY